MCLYVNKKITGVHKWSKEFQRTQNTTGLIVNTRHNTEIRNIHISCSTAAIKCISQVINQLHKTAIKINKHENIPMKHGLCCHT